MLPGVEDQLLALAPYIRKVARQRAQQQQQQQQINSSRIEPLATLDIGLEPCRKWTVPLLPDGPRRLDDPKLLVTAAATGGASPSVLSDLADMTSAEEWQSLGKKISTVSIGDSGGGNSAGQLTADTDGQTVTAPCKRALEQLLTEKRRECAVQAAYNDTLRQEGRGGGGVSAAAATAGASWRPRGVLVAHLTEHKGPVTGLAAVPDTTLLASTSADGTLRIWDCTKMEGRNIANKVRYIL
jgi:hypothetical protein